jgi:hypothetical protein
LQDSKLESCEEQILVIVRSNFKTVGVQDSFVILCANDRSLLVSGKEQQHSKLALLSSRSPVGAQDSNQLSTSWRSGYKESGNEQSIHKKLITGYPIWNPARSKISLIETPFY